MSKKAKTSQAPNSNPIANVILLPDREQATDALKLFLALELTSAPYGVSKDAPATVDSNARFLSGALLALTGADTVLFEPNTGVRYIFSQKTTESGDLAHAQTSYLSEWDASVLTPSIKAASGALTADVEAKLESFEALLKTGAQTSDAASVILFASLYPLAGSLTKAKAKLPSLAAWFSKLQGDKGFGKGVKAWERHTGASKQTSQGASLVDLPPPKVDGKVTIELTHHKQKILPKEGQRNILITSALPYVNNVPHLGNIIGCVLSADVYARFCRLRGYNTLYICGTDEHGTATETKALEEGISCQELCDKYHALHRQSYDWFQCDFDFFGRTTTKEQTQVTQDIFLKLEKNGHTFEDTITQLYCENHKAFLADRFVEGTCPLCGYDDARGDQCDKCGKLLNPEELINPRCKVCGTAGGVPVLRDSKHLFLNLTEAQPVLEKWIDKSSVEGAWSANTITITKAWLKEGLKPRCITRDLKWGVPVPKEGFDNKVFYVWFDAPIGYPSITANYTKDWEKWWKNPKDIQLYQFMGKDNVPFHTVLFPSSLIGTSDPWTLLHHLSTTEYLQYEGAKFSKSRNVGVFGINASESGISADVYRYYLLSNRPESSDSNFTWDAFAAANNNELLANFGNFVNRVVKFLNAKYDGVIPEYDVESEPERKFVEDVNALLAQYVKALEEVQLRAGLKLVMDISARGNLYLQENRIDNKLFAGQRERCDRVIASAANLCYLLSALVYPYMPLSSASILRQLNLPTRRIEETWSGRDILPGHQVGSAEYLFTNIEAKRVDELRAKYGGGGKAVAGAAEAAKGKGGKGGKKGAKASAEVLLSEAPAGVEKTPEILALEKQIKESGDLVRKLKAEKGDVAGALADLVAAKKKLTEVVGGKK
ncbi:hypothetical protein HDV00_002812 [Rhizophlyctis rosea]|nr:hypothetical protein HDV00_002812 [Rhizophlyctis rosea]